MWQVESTVRKVVFPARTELAPNVILLTISTTTILAPINALKEFTQILDAAASQDSTHPMENVSHVKMQIVCLVTNRHASSASVATIPCLMHVLSALMIAKVAPQQLCAINAKVAILL